MTKKDYIALAAALKSAQPPSNADAYARQQWLDCVRAVMEMCAKDNPNFRRNTFATACGITNVLDP
jgi:hypothetical protein